MAPKKKGNKGKKKAQQRTKKPTSSTAGPSSAASKGPGTSGEPSQWEPSSVAAPEAEAGPEVGDRGQLVGLSRRPDLIGRRVEVRGQVAGKDGAPRLAVRLLFGAGAGAVIKVKAANLELDKDHALGPALNTLVAAMQALAPGAVSEEERRDWAGGLPTEVLAKVAMKLVAAETRGQGLTLMAITCKGWKNTLKEDAIKAAGGLDVWRDWGDRFGDGLPEEVLAKIAETLVAQTEVGLAANLKGVLGWPELRIQREMEKRERDGNCLFVIAMVCKGWRKAQLKVGAPLRTRVESDVAMPGRVALVKWALAEGCPRDDGDGWTMAEVAAEHGHQELVQWLIQEQGFAMDGYVMAMAARGGNLELVRWLRGEGCDWNAWTCRCAAEAGRFGVLRWLRANGCPWDADTCERAAYGGHLALLRWARENGCNWDKACKGAASGGHLEVLRWLRANGCPWDADTCSWAAAGGHLETLRWARENGCDWGAQACLSAAHSGHLEVLQWLRAEGCPWNLSTCHYAVDQGHVEVLRWARENGAPWDAATRDRAAAELGYTDDLGNLV